MVSLNLPGTEIQLLPRQIFWSIFYVGLLRKVADQDPRNVVVRVGGHPGPHRRFTETTGLATTSVNVLWEGDSQDSARVRSVSMHVVLFSVLVGHRVDRRISCCRLVLRMV